MAKESDDGPIMAPHQAIELAPVGQGGESRTQVLPGVAVAAWFAGEMTSLAQESQGNHLGAGQGSPEARGILWRRLVFAEVISHHLKYGEEGVGVYHSNLTLCQVWG